MEKNIEKWINNNFKGSIVNKTILITGANSGIGYEVAYLCVSMGAKVILCVRNYSRGILARQKLVEAFPDYENNISIMLVDLSSFDSIDNFIEEIKNKNVDIDVFYHNAGILKAKENATTKQNFKLVMGSNYIGTYYLNERLLEYVSKLSHEVKIIFTTSISQYFAKINYNDFFLTKKYKNFKAYANSKLAITHYFIYLANKMENSNIKVLLVHPGITYTSMINKSFNKVISYLADKFMDIIFHKVSKAALSTIYLLNDDISNNTFVGPKGLFRIKGYPKKDKLSKKIVKNHMLTILKTKEIINKIIKIYN